MLDVLFWVFLILLCFVFYIFSCKDFADLRKETLTYYDRLRLRLEVLENEYSKFNK